MENVRRNGGDFAFKHLKLGCRCRWHLFCYRFYCNFCHFRDFVFGAASLMLFALASPASFCRFRMRFSCQHPDLNAPRIGITHTCRDGCIIQQSVGLWAARDVTQQWQCDHLVFARIENSHNLWICVCVCIGISRGLVGLNVAEKLCSTFMHRHCHQKT